MSRGRSIVGEAAKTARKMGGNGVPHVKIAAELAAKHGVTVDARTVGRFLHACGSPTGPQKRSRQPAPTVATAKPRKPASGAPGAFDERARLVWVLALLDADLEKDLPASDRARVSSEARSVGMRIAAIDAAAVAAVDADRTDTDAEWVTKRLGHFVAMRERAQEAVIATLPPEQAAAARRVLAAEVTLAALPDTDTEEDVRDAKAG